MAGTTMAAPDDEVVIVVEKGPRLLSVSESKWAEWTEDLAELECRMFSPKKEEYQDKPRYIYHARAYVDDTLVSTGGSMDYTDTSTKIKVRLQEIEEYGSNAIIALDEYDNETNQEVRVGGTFERNLLPLPGKFLVSLSEVFFEHKYIWWWGEEQTIHCYKCTLGLVPGIFITPVTVPDVLVPPIKKVVKQGEVAEFTSADGLEEGGIYVFGIDFFHAVDQAVNGLAYKFDNTTQDVFLVPVPGLGTAICPLLGIDPGTTECTVAIAEFIDPIYVANAFSKALYHKDLAGNEGTPEALDLIFVPLALASGIIPMGGMIKNTMGPILKGAKRGGIVATWLEKNKALIHAAGLAGDEIDSAVALDRIKEASRVVEGSDNQAALLDEAYRLMEDMVKDTKLTLKEVAQKQKAVVGAVTERVDNVKPKSKTSAEKVVKESGLGNAANVVPGVAKLHPRDTTILKSVLNKLRGKAPIRQEIEGELCELVSYSIKNGELSQTWKPLGTGFYAWLKRHKRATGLICAALVLFPWWFADNLVFLIWILRYAGTLERTWGDQWERAAKKVESEIWNMKEHPCAHAYQDNYINGLETMRRLIEGADPIPEDKIEKAKYNLKVCYAMDIGDPNAFVREAAWKSLNSYEQTYTKLAMGCSNPSIPPGGFITVDIPNPKYTAKVERVTDGDTFWVSSTDEEWPFEEDYEMRLLGVDTPDKKFSGSTIIGYKVRRIPNPDPPKEDPVLIVTRDDWVRATEDAWKLLEKQEVELEIDLDHAYDSTPLIRLLATVGVNRTEGPAFTGDFGEKQLREGNACVFFYEPNYLFNESVRDSYLAAEAAAKLEKKGIWANEGLSLPTGKIRCESAPEGASIYLDYGTASKGKTDKTLEDVLIGNHDIEFKGIRYSGTECKECKCGFKDLVVAEDKTTLADCRLTAIWNIKQPKALDDHGKEKNVYPDVWLDDGDSCEDTGLTAPCELIFGQDYSKGDKPETLRIGGRGCDTGRWKIELREEGYKAFTDEKTMNSGVYYVTRPVLEPTEWGDEEEPDEGTLHITIRDDVTKEFVSAHISVKDKNGVEQGKSITSYDTKVTLPVTGSPYILQLTHDDYHTYIHPYEIWIGKDRTTPVVAYLTPEAMPEPDKAILTILKPYYLEGAERRPINYAEVWIDEEDKYRDKFTGSVSELKITIDMGTHTIVLKAAGLNSKAITLNIMADHIIGSQEMTKIHAATIVDPRTYPKEFNVGYEVMCPIAIVNASDSGATFIVSQTFEGIDVYYTMKYTSPQIYVSAGEDKIVNIPITIPIEAIPEGLDIANYAINTRLEVV